MLGPAEVIEAALSGDTAGVPDGYSANALVLAAAGQHGEVPLCGRLLSLYAPVNVLGVAIQHDPSYYARLCRRHLDRPPARLGIVDVGAATESPDPGGVEARVEQVSSPDDLTGLGIQAMNFLKAWADTDAPTVVCFDSLTPLLRYADVDRAYRFLDVTTSRLNQVCAVSHAHVNPRAHDEQDVQALMGVFDAVVEPGDDPDGPADWTVRGA